MSVFFPRLSGLKDDSDTDSNTLDNSTDEEGPPENKKATKYTLEQREAITKVRNCEKKDYYRILGLDKSCSDQDINNASSTLMSLTNPENNKFEDALKAFQMVKRACQVLGNSKERIEYDRNRWRFERVGLFRPLNSWGEEFAANASGTDSGDSGSDDDDSEDEEEKPDEFRKNIYKEATPLVHKLLRDPEDSASKEQIQILNKRITKQNKKERFAKDEFHINLRVLGAIASAARTAIQDANKKMAKNELEKLEKQLATWVRANSYAPEWLCSLNPSSKKKDDIHTLIGQMVEEWTKGSRQATERLLAQVKEALDATE